MAIRLEQVTYRYEDKHARSSDPVLRDLSTQLEGGRFTVICGPPGSGKSTLLQLLNGILLPSEGCVHVLDYRIEAGQKLKGANELRRKVGLVFQFPERQFFEATVREDMMFGPLCFGASREEADRLAIEVCRQLGMEEAILDASPHTLSGGQLRKAAIGAVLTADPDILVLDEPTASLDAASREGLLVFLRRWCDMEGKSIILVTHRLDEVLPYADEYIVLRNGKILFQGDPTRLLASIDTLEGYGIDVPQVMRLLVRFAKHYGVELPATGRTLYDVEKIADYMSEVLKGRDRYEDDDPTRSVYRDRFATA